PRFDLIFKMVGMKPQARTCAAIVAIIEDGQQIIKEYRGSPALDAGLVAAAQAIEYYEIARYGALRAWAQELGLTEAVSLLDKTLDEEEDADDALSDLTEVVARQAAPRDQAACLAETDTNRPRLRQLDEGCHRLACGRDKKLANRRRRHHIGRRCGALRVHPRLPAGSFNGVSFDFESVYSLLSGGVRPGR